MTPEAAIHDFLSSFEIPAYAATSVPDEGSDDWAGFPYLTYNLVVGTWGGGDVPMQVDLWYRTESEATPNAKVREMSRRIGMGGTCLPCDGGMLWVRRGSPWAQSVADSTDSSVKRRYINMDIEFITSE